MLTEKLSPQSRAFVATAEQIAHEVVEPLAETWDRENRFPHELFAALHKARLNAMCVPRAQGGLGIGPDTDEPLTKLAERKAAGAAQGPPDRIERHHARGKLTARERIALLCDPGTFVEYGVLATGMLTTPGRGMETVPADGVITGYGLINGRRVYVVADDATVPGGSARGTAAYLKVSQVKRCACEEGWPVVSLLEASAGRVQDLLGSQFAMSRGDFIEEVRASGLIPRVVALMGGGFGQPSFLAMLSDFRPIVKGTGFMGMSGPPVVEAASHAAAFGGVTTIIDFAGDLSLHALSGGSRDSILKVLERRREVFRTHAYTDFAFHYILAGPMTPETVGMP